MNSYFLHCLKCKHYSTTIVFVSSNNKPKYCSFCGSKEGVIDGKSEPENQKGSHAKVLSINVPGIDGRSQKV